MAPAEDSSKRPVHILSADVQTMQQPIDVTSMGGGESMVALIRVLVVHVFNRRRAVAWVPCAYQENVTERMEMDPSDLRTNSDKSLGFEDRYRQTVGVEKFGASAPRDTATFPRSKLAGTSHGFRLSGTGIQSEDIQSGGRNGRARIGGQGVEQKAMTQGGCSDRPQPTLRGRLGTIQFSETQHRL